MLKNFNLRMKMLFFIGLVTFVSFAVTIGFVAVTAGRMAEKEAVEKAAEMAHRYGGVVKAEVEGAMGAARTLANTLAGMKRSGNVPERRVLDQALKQVLEGTPSFLTTWTCWGPNALDGRDRDYVNAPGHDGTGRYIPCWSRIGETLTLEPLVDYDEAGAGDYYLLAKRSGKETVIEPYLYELGGKEVLLTTLAVPVRHNGRVLGVTGVDMALETFHELFSKIKVYDTGYISILSNNGTYVAHSSTEKIGRSVFETDDWADGFADKIRSGEAFTTENHSETVGGKVARICVPVRIGRSDTPWTVIVNIPKAKVREKANEILYVSMITGAVAMVVLMATVFLITGNITEPIKKGVDFAETMSQGDFTQTLEVRQNDEVGKLAGALNNMTSQLGTMIGEIYAGVETLSSSSTDLAAISEQMAQGSRETSEKSETVATAAEEMSASMGSIAAAMEQASTNVSVVAAASEEMTATIGEVARNTETARTITDNAVFQAKTASGRVEELGMAAREIGNVTETITEISEQTNLLALNATIEAARAGEAGKGFAVVATEIKDLASQTADATQDIRKKIAGIQDTTSASVEAIAEITQIIDEINEIVTATATAVEEQSVTTKEIAGNVAQASQGLAEINDNVAQSSTVSEMITKDISEVSGQAGEMSESSSQVSSNAEELLKLAGQLKKMVGSFQV